MTTWKSIQIEESQTGHTTFIDDFRALKTASAVNLAGGSFFTNNKDTNFWAETVTGTGSVTQANGVATLATGTTANSTTQYQSVRVARFIPGMINFYRGVLRVGDTGAANNIRNWGIFDSSNGAFFQLSGTTMNIVTRNGSSDTVVSKASWNKDNTFTLDTNYHEYEIHVSYIEIEFWIDEVLVHKVSYGTALPALTLNLPITMQNNNTNGAATNVSLIVSVAIIDRLGQLINNSTYKNITTATTTVLKQGTGMLHRIVINNPTGTITVYDNTAGSGTTIAGIDSTSKGTLTFDLPFSFGLTIVTSGATNITVIYE